MHRFFVPEENRTENEIVIHGDDVNHIRNVLRMTKGEKIMVSCGKGVDYECEILSLSAARSMSPVNRNDLFPCTRRQVME